MTDVQNPATMAMMINMRLTAKGLRRTRELFEQRFHKRTQRWRAFKVSGGQGWLGDEKFAQAEKCYAEEMSMIQSVLAQNTNELRCYHLAHMALRGVPYKDVEQKPKSNPDWGTVISIVVTATVNEWGGKQGAADAISDKVLEWARGERSKVTMD